MRDDARDPAPGRDERTAAGGWLIVALAVVGFALRDLVSTDRLVDHRDLVVFVAPFKHFLGERLGRGELPLWNPYVYLGTPFLASLQSGVLYPPSLLLLLPFPLGLNLFLLLHYAIATVGAWALARGRGLSPVSAAIGAVVFSLGGFMVSLLSLTNDLQSAAWTPWLLVLWTRERAWTPACFVRLVLVLALQILGGAPEIVLMTLALMASWSLREIFHAPRTSLRQASALGAAVMVASLLLAFQILPTAEAIGQSSRGAGLDYRVIRSWSLDPRSLLKLVLPRFERPDEIAAGLASFESTEPWLYTIYLGIVTIPLVLAGVAAARERVFWALAAAASVVLALGDHMPVFPAIHASLPWLVSKFRFPEKFLFVAHVAASLLAAEGTCACLRRDSRALRAAQASGLLLLALCAAVIGLRHADPELYLRTVAALGGRAGTPTLAVPLALAVVAKAARGALLLAALAAALALLGRDPARRGTLASVLALLVAADLGFAHGALFPTLSWSAVRADPPFVDVEALRRTHQRVFPYQTFSSPVPGEIPRPIFGLETWGFLRDYGPALPNDVLRWRVQMLDLPMITGIGTLGGVDGIVRNSQNELATALRSLPRERAVHLLAALGTALLIGPEALDAASLEPLESTRGTPIFGYRVRDAAPAAYLASRLVEAPTDPEALARMSEATFHPGRDAIVRERPSGWQDGEDAGATGELAVLGWHDEQMRFRVTATRSAFLVIGDSWFPGWEARIDGDLTDLRPANALVRGIVVPAGDHLVELVYRPASFRTGVKISLATVLVLAIAVAVASRSAKLNRG